MARQLVECVPNFSEGQNLITIQQIADAIRAVLGVQLLHIDTGHAAHRTVITFVGEPAAVVEAAFQAIQVASKTIDMRIHRGEHPRMGATDVCPLIPIANISMEEVVALSHQLAKRVGEELHIPVYLYEASATRPERRNLAYLRAGEYEALPTKLAQSHWKPDYGPATVNAYAGATVIGARNFLLAYNVNLNTTSVQQANAVAFDVREIGRTLRDAAGNLMLDADGKPLRRAGKCKAVKAIGWYIEEYGKAQVSMNLTDIQQTTMHEAYEACRESAEQRGLQVTGSELIGMTPLHVLLDAGRYFLQKAGLPTAVSEEELIQVAIQAMGLDEVQPFRPEEKIIEYRMKMV